MAEHVITAVNPDGTYIASSPVALTQPISSYAVPAPSGGLFGYALADSPGVVAAYNFMSVMNPIGSGKNVYLAQINVSRYSIAGASSPNSLLASRTSAHSGGTLIPAGNVLKFDNTTPNTIVEVRTGSTATHGILVNAFAPPVGTNSSPRVDQLPGNPAGPFVLQPGEGLVIGTLAGDIDQKWNIGLYWVEAL